MNTAALNGKVDSGCPPDGNQDMHPLKEYDATNSKGPSSPPSIESIVEKGESWDTWKNPKPIPSLLLVEVLPEDSVPREILDFARDVAERMSCPVDYPVAGALVVLGSAAGNAVLVQPKARDTAFTVPLNQWGMLIGPPSSKKTPALDEVKMPLEMINMELQEEYQEQLKEHAARLEAMKGEDGQEELDPPKPLRTVVNNATPEALADILVHNPRGLLMFRDELAGWIAEFERPGRESERAFYLEGFNGKSPFTFDRIKRGTITLKRNCLSVLGGAQPGPFREILTGNGKPLKCDGFMQRFSLAVWPEPVPFEYVDREPDHKAIEVYRERVRTLHKIQHTKPMTFKPDAQALYETWVTELNRKASRMPENMASHVLKYQKSIPGIAAIYELVQNPEAMTISRESWIMAEKFANYLESHARRIYGSISPVTMAARAITDRLQDLEPTFTSRDIHRAGWKGLDEIETVKAALGLLSELGWIRRQPDTPGKPGRPSEVWCINPDALE